MRKTYCSVVFFLLSGLCGCLFAQQQTYSVETIDGVRYVHNNAPAWGDNPCIALEKVRVFGSAAGEDEHYAFDDIRSLTVDQDGNLYVLDGGKCRIQKFDPQGRYVATIGQKGNGPGEFTSPMYIEVDRTGNLYVHETGNFVMALDSDGTEKYRMQSGGMRLQVIRTLNNGYFLMSLQDAGLDAPLIGVFDRNFTLVSGIGRKTGFGSGRYDRLGNAAALTLDQQGNIYVSLAAQNKVQKYSIGGRLLWEADRPLNFELGPQVINDVETMVLAAIQIGVDHKDRAWVATFDRLFTQEELSEHYQDIGLMSFHIFDKDGVFLGSIPARMFQNMQFVFGDRVFMINLSEKSVYEYRIVEK